jgi:hypothetical protein
MQNGRCKRSGRFLWRSVSDGKFEPAIEKLFAIPGVDYLQVNSTTAGCFTFRIERPARRA